MAEGPRRSSPLEGFFAVSDVPEAAEAPGVRLSERAFLGHLNLRGDPSNDAFLRGVAAALGFNIPLEPNSVVEGHGTTALWLGPDEWLVLTAPDQQLGIAAHLRASLSEVLAAVTDVSAGQTVINLQGPRSREVLGKGCTLDLHPRAFGPGQCAQTNVAKASVILWQRDESPSYDVIVRRSFADYLAHWLADAAREYGLATGTSQGP